MPRQICHCPSLSLQEIGEIVFDGRPRIRDHFVLLKTYIDESADRRQEKVACVGAFTGTRKQWDGLKQKWYRRLTKDGIGYFRSAEYYSLRGEFDRFRDPLKYPKPKGSVAAMKVRDDLEAIIVNTEVVGCGMCILIDDWKAALASDSKASQILTNPFEIATQLLISDLHKLVIEEIGKGNRLTFIADESQSARRMEKVYLEFKRINPQIKDISGFTHLDDKENAPLQVADMMAGIAREVALECLTTSGLLRPKRLEGRISWIRRPGLDFFQEMIRLEKIRRKLS